MLVTEKLKEDHGRVQLESSRMDRKKCSLEPPAPRLMCQGQAPQQTQRGTGGQDLSSGLLCVWVDGGGCRTKMDGK